MSSIAKEVVDLVNSYAIIKEKDEGERYFELTVKFDFDSEWIEFEILDNYILNRECIRADMGAFIEKNDFVGPFMETLCAYAFKNFYISINVIDCEDNKYMLQTESTSSMREKVANLTNLNLLEIFEVNIPEHQAKFFFFTSQERFCNFFITSCYTNDAARELMEKKLKEEFKKFSVYFMANCKYDFEPTVKRCIDEAIERIKAHITVITKPLEDSPIIAKKDPNVVDLTAEVELSLDDFTDELIQELDEDILNEARVDYEPCDEFTFDPEFFIEWLDYIIKNQDKMRNDEYLGELEMHEFKDNGVTKDNIKPRIIKEEPPKSEFVEPKKVPLNVSQSKSNATFQTKAKISFSSGPKIIKPHTMIPARQTSKSQANQLRNTQASQTRNIRATQSTNTLKPAMPRHIQAQMPRLNRGNESMIDLKAKLPKSNLFSDQELQNFFDNTAGAKSNLKDYKIPKKPQSSQTKSVNDPYYSIFQAKKSRLDAPNRPLDPPITYNKTIPASEGLKSAIKKLVDKLIPYTSPTVNEAADDDISIIEEPKVSDPMPGKENQNHGPMKRKLFNPSESQIKFGEDRKFFKNRGNSKFYDREQ